MKYVTFKLLKFTNPIGAMKFFRDNHVLTLPQAKEFVRGVTLPVDYPSVFNKNMEFGFWESFEEEIRVARAGLIKAGVIFEEKTIERLDEWDARGKEFQEAYNAAHVWYETLSEEQRKHVDTMCMACIPRA